MAGLTLNDLLAHVLDEGSLVSWDEAPLALEYEESYAAQIARAQEKTGRDEAVVTGSATIRGRRIAFVAGDPAFLGGSIGVATAERLTRSIERATAEQLPLIAFPVGGGTRMQEGTVAFLQMTKITQAVMDHKAANLPYLVYLRNPTMGGVFASWGSLGHVTISEPDALVGFLGPRVYEAIYGRPFPPGIQHSNHLQELGIIDMVATPEELPTIFTKILNVLMARREGHLLPEETTKRPDAVPQAELPDVDAWESILQTRRDDRPGLGDLLMTAATDVTMLNGTGAGETHPGSVLALANFRGAPCIVLGQCRQGQQADNPLDAGALREARRGLRLSRELRLPLLTVIDTPGAALSKEAEEGGLAGEIARTLSELITLPTPTVSLLMGQGTGGIALALAPTDCIIAAQHAWLSPLPPEGASAIVHRDTEHAADMARLQGVRSRDLLANRIVDVVIPEPEDAASSPEEFCTTLADAVAQELRALMLIPRKERLAARHEKYRRLGL